jgi:hypothetical protein
MGRGAGEPAQDRLGRSRAGPDRGGVLDHLVILLGDQLPADRPGQRRRQGGVGVRLAGSRPVQLYFVDLLDPREQVEAEQPGDPEADLGLAVGVGVAGLHAHRGAVPDGALDHGVHLRRRAGQVLAVHHHRPALDVPVDQHTAAAVPGPGAGIPAAHPAHDVARPGRSRPGTGRRGVGRGTPAEAERCPTYPSPWAVLHSGLYSLTMRMSGRFCCTEPDRIVRRPATLLRTQRGPLPVRMRPGNPVRGPASC